MVSEPKAHLTKSKAVKRQKEKSLDNSCQDLSQQQLLTAAGGPLMAYYMSGMLTTSMESYSSFARFKISVLAGAGLSSSPITNSLPNAKRPRVEEGDSIDSET